MSAWSGRKVERLHLSLDKETIKTIDRLQKTFNVSTRSAVLSRCLALATVAAENVGSDNTVTLLDSSGEKLKVLMN